MKKYSMRRNIEIQRSRTCVEQNTGSRPMKQQTKICILLMTIVVGGTMAICGVQQVTASKSNTKDVARALSEKSEYRGRLALQRTNGIKAGDIKLPTKKDEHSRLRKFYLMPEFDAQERWRVIITTKSEAFDVDPETNEPFQAVSRLSNSKSQYNIRVENKDDTIIVEQEQALDESMDIEDYKKHASMYFGQMELPEKFINFKSIIEGKPRVSFKTQSMDEVIKHIRKVQPDAPTVAYQTRALEQRQLSFARHFATNVCGMLAGGRHFDGNSVEEVWSAPLDRPAEAFDNNGLDPFGGSTMLSTRNVYTGMPEGQKYLTHITRFAAQLSHAHAFAKTLCENSSGQKRVGWSTGYRYTMDIKTHRPVKTRSIHIANVYDCVDRKPHFKQRLIKTIFYEFKRL